MKNTVIMAVIAAAIGVCGVYVGTILAHHGSDSTKIASYYAHEVATLQSPHGLRKALADGTAEDKYVLVDVRSKGEYEDEHMVTAYSIPAYLTRDNVEHTTEERIIADFKELRDANEGKQIIIYCYSSSCMTGRKIGNLLAENDIYVKELTVGWNEWRYFPQTWNYPHEWEDVDMLDYVSVGSERGVVPAGLAPKGCPIDGGLGC